MARRLPIGAELLPGGGASFRVWAPKRRRVEVLIEGGSAHPLDAEPGGYFSGRVAAAGAKTLYRYRLDGGDAFPDPASRFQPDGPHGPSMVVDPAFAWRDAGWKGRAIRGQVLYETKKDVAGAVSSWERFVKVAPNAEDRERVKKLIAEAKAGSGPR